MVGKKKECVGARHCVGEPGNKTREANEDKEGGRGQTRESIVNGSCNFPSRESGYTINEWTIWPKSIVGSGMRLRFGAISQVAETDYVLSTWASPSSVISGHSHPLT